MHGAAFTSSSLATPGSDMADVDQPALSCAAIISMCMSWVCFDNLSGTRCVNIKKLSALRHEGLSACWRLISIVKPASK